MRNKSFVWHAAFIISKIAEEEDIASIAEIQSGANRENYERFIRIRNREEREWEIETEIERGVEDLLLQLWRALWIDF